LKRRGFKNNSSFKEYPALSVDTRKLSQN